MNELEKQLQEKRSKLEALSTEVRDLVEKEGSSVDDIKNKVADVKALKQEIDDISAKIDALATVGSGSGGHPGTPNPNGQEPKPNNTKPNEPTPPGPTPPVPPKDPNARDDDEPYEEDDLTGQKQKQGVRGLSINLTQKTKQAKVVRSIEDYVRSHGQTRDEGLTSGDIGPMVPEQIIYNPEAEIDSVFDLSKLVTKTPATTASGTYPILKRATAIMNSVEELAESPSLAKPDFENVTWKIVTYRGKIPISEESLQDTQVPLMPVIQKNAGEQRLNTLNKAISDKLTAFTAKASTADTLTDDLKHILNVDLDPAYNKSIVVSQSAYQILDTLKDKEGRYLLQESITAASGITLFGKQVVIVNDELMGAVGEAHIWLGDLKRAILYVNRIDTQIVWVKNEIYGQYLGLVMRFDVEIADAAAGYFVTVGAADEAASK